MRLAATFDNVILKVLPKTIKKGLIQLPDKAAQESDFCEVVDMGPDTTGKIVNGDIVLRPTGLYEWHDEKNDETYIVVAEKDIVAWGLDHVEEESTQEED